MTNTDPTRGIDLEKQPHASILKRIDIGLTTGIIAVFIAFMSLLVARAQTKMALEAQKASVLPIIDIDMGYLRKPNPKGEMKQHFEITLNNVGAGIAHIQSVYPMQTRKQIADSQAFEDAIMTRRMRSWANLTEKPATGYLRAGESVTPVSYYMGAAERDLSAYLRGEWGLPMDGVDVQVCYCSVFDDCWYVEFLSSSTPTPVEHCYADGTTHDGFKSFTDQRAAARINANNE